MAEPSINLILPWPPSVNSYWRHPSSGRLAGRHLISSSGRAYRQAVTDAWIKQGAGIIVGPHRLELTIYAYPPDRRRRDLDNLLKGALDSLVSCGVFEDDSQIDALCIHRLFVVKDGSLDVSIKIRQEESNGNEDA